MTSLHVAVALIVDTQSVLIALRKPEQHQGGLWEFPGGKVEPGETVLTALKREIQEELALSIQAAEPFMQIEHAYLDKTVLLDIWWVNSFTGQALGREGQEIKWCDVSTLGEYAFPAANAPIVDALQKKMMS
jgi:8-oxo-dGTP diphosphatase